MSATVNITATSVTPAAAVGPSGATDATRLVCAATTGVNDCSAIQQLVSGLTDGVPVTLSVYLKRESGGTDFYIGAQAGSAPYAFQGQTKCTVTTSWARYACTFTPAGTAIYVTVGPNQSVVGQANTAAITLLMADMQLEANPVRTSYIPTTTATVSRTADVVTIAIPADMNTLEYLFDDSTIQDITVSPSTTYTVLPAGLNRSRIKRRQSLFSE